MKLIRSFQEELNSISFCCDRRTKGECLARTVVSLFKTQCWSLWRVESSYFKRLCSLCGGWRRFIAVYALWCQFDRVLMYIFGAQETCAMTSYNNHEHIYLELIRYYHYIYYWSGNKRGVSSDPWVRKRSLEVRNSTRKHENTAEPKETAGCTQESQ